MVFFRDFEKCLWDVLFYFKSNSSAGHIVLRLMAMAVHDDHGRPSKNNVEKLSITREKVAVDVMNMNILIKNQSKTDTQ